MPAIETSASPTVAPYMLAEFEQQAPATRKFIERMPAGKLTWKPHEKSMTAGQLAFHLATVPGGIIRFVQGTTLEVPGAFTFPQPASIDEILKAFDESIAAIREILPKFDDAAMFETLHLMSGGRELAAIPRIKFVRDILFSHWYQHRGQFSVYLRLLDVPVPATWGPSADEAPVFG